VCFSNIIVELKALSSFTKVEESQLLHYLKAARMHRGLLVNFGSKSLQHKRLVWGPETRGEFEGGFDNIAPETE